jgi:hypothetical protein
MQYPYWCANVAVSALGVAGSFLTRTYYSQSVQLRYIYRETWGVLGLCFLDHGVSSDF